MPPAAAYVKEGGYSFHTISSFDVHFDNDAASCSVFVRVSAHDDSNEEDDVHEYEWAYYTNQVL